MSLKKRLLLMERDHPSVFALLNLRMFFNLLRNVLIFIRFARVALLAPVAFLASRFQMNSPAFVMIATRDAHIGPCSLQLIDMVCQREDRALVLSVKNRARFRQINADLLSEAGFDVSDIVEQDSFAALRYACRARVHIAFESVFETFVAANCPDVWLGRSAKPVLVPDGVVTKTNGNLIPSNKIVGAGLRSWLIGRAARRICYVSQSGVDTYRTCLNTGVRSPSLMRPVGLPRFLRAQNLLAGKSAPLLTQNFRAMLATDTSDFRIMLALTKNKEASDLDFFLKQMDLSFPELDALLAASNTSLWIKSHQSTLPLGVEKDNSSDTQQRVFAVGPADGLSSVDLFGSFDALMTDISSIYVDFLPFDKPIGFIRFDSWMAEDRFCYPESPFYPGTKLNTPADLEGFLSNLSQEDAPQALERDFARKVLLGNNTDEAFWTELL